MKSREILIGVIGLVLVGIIIYQQYTINKQHQDGIFQGALSTYYTLGGVISGLHAFQRDHGGTYPVQMAAKRFPDVAALSKYINPTLGQVASWTYQCTPAGAEGVMSILIADAGRNDAASILKNLITRSFAVKNKIILSKDRGTPDIQPIITTYPDYPHEENPFATITVPFPNVTCGKNGH